MSDESMDPKRKNLGLRERILASKRKNSLITSGEKRFYFFTDALLVFFLLLVAYPIIYVFSASFSNPSAIVAGKVKLWPVGLSLSGYAAVFREPSVWMGYRNTLFYTVFGTIISLVLTILCAYPLSRKDFVGRNLFMFIVTFTMIFSGGMLPTYIVVKSLGILNTRWAMLLPGAVGAWNVIVTRTYYQTNVSDELLDAAYIDGCNDYRFLAQIVIPLTAPITAVMVLFYAVGNWNAYFSAFLYLTNRSLFPLQLFLREILILNQINQDLILDPALMAARQGMADLLKFSLIIVASLPIWCAYPFVQKYFVKGIMVGAIKG
ncbi:MAG: carbohydrate ABC transporter permease [Treponema sp.]|nr:carbohydrate ABC transporter permease [Treponema sp.]